MREFPFKTLVALLVGAVLAAPLGAQDLPASSGTTDQPAGCHESAPVAPAPAPSSHQCCQSGHDSAILLAALSSGPSLHISTLIELPQGGVPLAVLHCLPGLAIAYGDPPILSPLRV
jgi:hypothetical protein